MRALYVLMGLIAGWLSQWELAAAIIGGVAWATIVGHLLAAKSARARRAASLVSMPIGVVLIALLVPNLLGFASILIEHIRRGGY